MLLRRFSEYFLSAFTLLTDLRYETISGGRLLNLMIWRTRPEESPVFSEISVDEATNPCFTAFDQFSLR